MRESIDNISHAVNALEWLAFHRRPESIVWVDQNPLAVDALRGSLYEIKWRGTLTEYFIDNLDQLEPLAERACDRLMQTVQPEWSNEPPILSDCKVGLGTYGWKYDPNVITAALDSGVGLIDTAETYGYGRTETALGEALRDYVEIPLIATKVSRNHLSYRSIRNAADRSASRLGLEWLGLYQIHWPNPKYDLEISMKAMRFLLESGVIDAVGVCNFSVDQLIAAQSYIYPYGCIESIQIRYNLSDRGIERFLLPYCQSIGMPVIAYSPLGQKFSRMLQADGGVVLVDISKRCGASAAQVALAWIMSRGGVIPIPRTNDPEHAVEIAESVDVELESEEVEWLNEAFPVKE